MSQGCYGDCVTLGVDVIQGPNEQGHIITNYTDTITYFNIGLGFNSLFYIGYVSIVPSRKLLLYITPHCQLCSERRGQVRYR